MQIFDDVETNDYFAISSVGALVEGWTLIVPKKHCCSMKALYSEKQFAEFTSNVIEVKLESLSIIRTKM